MAVRIRMKKLGRKHRPFYRICAMESRSPRDGRVLEELGTYDPMVPDTDARVTLNAERVDHWLSVGALPTDKVKVLIKKYGTGGTNVEQQAAAREKLLAGKQKPMVNEPKPPQAGSTEAKPSEPDATEPQAAE